MKGVEKLNSMLEASGLPFRYRAFSDETVPDDCYCVYQFLYSENMAADGNVYKIISKFQIDMFTKTKNIEAEEQLEAALSSVYWEKEEEYIDDQACYRITYLISLEDS